MSNLIPPGTYKARALAGSGEFGKSKTKGTDFVRVQFAIVGGDHNGRSLGWDGWFGENSAPRTIDSLRYCGCTFPNNDVTDLSSVDTNEVQVVVEHEQYEKDGEARTVAKIAWVNSGLRGIQPEQLMGAAGKAAFRQKMLGYVAHAKTKPAAAAQVAPAGVSAPAAAAAHNDPIPF